MEKRIKFRKRKKRFTLNNGWTQTNQTKRSQKRKFRKMQKARKAATRAAKDVRDIKEVYTSPIEVEDEVVFGMIMM